MLVSYPNQVGPLISCFFEAPLDRDLMAWALKYYGPDLLDIKVMCMDGWSEESLKLELTRGISL